MASGIIDVSSRYSVPETLARLQAILKEKGITVFAVIDHSGEAEKVGLRMRPTQLLIFGSPKAGTPLMVAAPRSGYRPSLESAGLARRAGAGVALLQFS